jgi:hypothetical protein
MRLKTHRRHPSARSLSRSFRLLAPVVALAAFALFPVIAGAETSSEKVYHLAAPGVESTGPERGGQTTAPTRSHPGPGTTPGHHVATTGTAGEETGVATAPGPNGEPESRVRHRPRTVSPDEGGDHHAGGGGHPGGGSGNGPHAPGADGTGPTRTATSAIDGGGSSPVLPILIAAAVLAAISIAVAFYRERRQGDRPRDPSVEV